MAGYHPNALRGDRERDLRTQDVGRHIGDRTAFRCTGTLDRSRGRRGGLQISAHPRVASTNVAATTALCVMGLLAAMLAVTGIFGMAAYNVSRRMKELGIRVALGARSKHVMSAAVGRPIVLLGVGSLVGLLLGVFASRLLGQIVYQANPRDPVVVGGAVR